MQAIKVQENLNATFATVKIFINLEALGFLCRLNNPETVNKTIIGFSA